MNTIGGAFTRGCVKPAEGGERAGAAPVKFTGGALTANPDLIKECAVQFSAGGPSGAGKTTGPAKTSLTDSSLFGAGLEHMTGGAAGRLATGLF